MARQLAEHAESLPITMTGRRLRVRTRSEPPSGSTGESNWTLFARLAPQTVRALTRDVNVEFLPLRLSGDELEEDVYVSYNGGSIQEQGCIEVAAGTLPEDVAHVDVSFLESPVPDAVTVEVEPLTTNDWESIEVYAELLQEGGLLQQVSVVYLRQVLNLRVGHSKMVRVRVTEATASPCRLLADTEVHIRPKPRRLQKKSSCVLRLLPSWDDYSSDMQRLHADPNDTVRLKVAPCTVLVNPEVLQECGLECGSFVQLQNVRKGNTMAVGRIQASLDVRNDSTVLHTSLRYQLDASPLLDSIRLEAIDTDMLDSSCAVEMMNSGTLCCSLELVRSVEIDADKEHAWLLPNSIHRQHVWCNFFDVFSKRDATYQEQLRSILASWLDVSDRDADMPFCNGTLIRLHWQHENEKDSDDHNQMFRLRIYSVPVEEEEDNHAGRLYVLAKDLPYVLIKSPSQPSSHDEAVVISLNKRENMLNLLPPTPDLSSMDQSNHAVSDLTVSLECFDAIVVSGEVGSGKTHAALMLAAHARVNNSYATLYLDCKRLQSSLNVRMKDILVELTSLFEQGAKSRPCLIVLDDIDELVPNVSIGSDQEEGSAHQQQPNPVAADQSKLIADHIQNLTNDASSRESEGKIVLVMTCREEQSINPTILSQLLCQSVSIPSLNTFDREELFLSMARNLSDRDIMMAQNALPQDFGSKTEGFRPRDLDIVATRVLHTLRSLLTSNESASFVDEAIVNVLNAYTPISRQGIRAEDTISSISWCQVGGLFRVKECLSSSLLRPVQYRRIYEHAPIQLPRGIVLYGPPGCGKSYLVPALAKECGLTMITCRGPELLDKYIGASEAKVRQLFERAYAAAPSLLFLDEFDALAPVRGSDHTGVTDRVVNQLLTYLDGVEDSSNGSVYIVAATSRPDKVDPALLRPGRLEQHIFVGFPASTEEWHSILEKTLDGRSVDDRLQEAVQNRSLWETKGADHIRSYSPSDIKAAVDTAYLNAVHEYLADNDESSDGGVQETPVTIQMHHMVESLRSTRPSLSTNDRRMLNRVYGRYISASESLGEVEPTPAIVQGRQRTALK